MLFPHAYGAPNDYGAGGPQMAAPYRPGPYPYPQGTLPPAVYQPAYPEVYPGAGVPAAQFVPVSALGDAWQVTEVNIPYGVRKARVGGSYYAGPDYGCACEKPGYGNWLTDAWNEYNPVAVARKALNLITGGGPDFAADLEQSQNDPVVPRSSTSTSLPPSPEPAAPSAPFYTNPWFLGGVAVLGGVAAGAYFYYRK